MPIDERLIVPGVLVASFLACVVWGIALQGAVEWYAWAARKAGKRPAPDELPRESVFPDRLTFGDAFWTIFYVGFFYLLGVAVFLKIVNTINGRLDAETLLPLLPVAGPVMVIGGFFAVAAMLKAFLGIPTYRSALSLTLRFTGTGLIALVGFVLLMSLVSMFGWILAFAIDLYMHGLPALAAC